MLEDTRSRERALDPTKSFIVQAPAGSGKTELLIQRYLRLLTEVQAPGAVVAITFTKKAAAEMRARVLDALRKAASGIEPQPSHERTTYKIARGVLDHDQQRGWKLLSNPAQMRIGTIDALCMDITRQMPWLARFGAPPDITEKAEDLYHEAARNTLRGLEIEERDNVQGPISRLLLHLDNNFGTAQTLIAQMLEKRDQWLRLTGLNRDLARIRAQLEQSLQKLILAELKTLPELFDEMIAREITVLCGFSGLPQPRLDHLDSWQAIADLVLTKQGDLRKRPDTNVFHKNHPNKRRCDQLLTALQGQDELLAALKALRELPSPYFEDSQWNTMEAVLSILPIAVAELEVVFRERGTTDFAELSIRALRALGNEKNPTDLALVLGYRLEHILVDEYQDTSYTQYDLLKRLTAAWESGDARTLFLVGDPMQSIYRFRQADVSLFLKARSEGIGAVRMEPLHLRSNFRSGAEIIEWVNATFAQIFPRSENVDDGAVRYEASEYPGGQDRAADKAVHTHAFFNQADEAERVVELVKEAVGQKVAILVRARTHLSAIVPALKRAGIRFQAIEIDELGRRPVIQDLMALTFALLHLADRVSWLAVLRGPWCGLTLHDLLALAAPDPSSTIWDLLEKKAPDLSTDGQTRIERIRPILHQALEHRGRVGLRDWIEGTWFMLGGPACVREDVDLDDAVAYFDLLEGLENGADLEDLGWFRQQVSELFAQPDTKASDALQIMTIHKAKGLEFDCVILPGLDARSRKDDSPLLVWREQAGDLLLAPIKEASQSSDRIYDYLWRLEQRKAENETARLLYVAATRAREHLHLMGCVRMDEKTAAVAAPPSTSFLGILWGTMGFPFAPSTPPQPKIIEAKARQIRRLPAYWRAPAPPLPVEWTPAEVPPVEHAEITFDWVGDTLRLVGTAIHGYLQRFAREGLEAWNDTRVRSQRVAYQTILGNLGVPPAEMADAVDRIEAGLLQVLRDPKGRWVLDQHAEAESEYSITGVIEGQEYRAVIDRTFVDESGVRWIIDYKTSTHEGGHVEAFLDNERERYRAQLEQYARLLVQVDGRPINLALYFPLLHGWREWAAPAAMLRQASLFEL